MLKYVSSDACTYVRMSVRPDRRGRREEEKKLPGTGGARVRDVEAGDQTAPCGWGHKKS